MRLQPNLLCLVFLVALVGCSHSYGIQKSYAFKRKITAGNIPVDQHNNPTTTGVQIVHLIYIETTNQVERPLWDTAWVGGTPYKIDILRIPGDSLYVGKMMGDGSDIVIQPLKGNRLWQLLLSPLKRFYAKADQNEQKQEVVLSGTWKNKRVTYTIGEEKQLATIYGE